MCSNYEDKIVNDIRTDLRQSINNSNLHDFVTNRCDRNSNLSKLDINFLLKCYILSQVINDDQNDFDKKLFNTPNPNIKKDSENNYYKITESGFQKCNIIKVYDNGYYLAETKRNSDSLRIHKIFNQENQITEISIADSTGRNIDDKNISAELLGLKKEFKKKYKLSGYSGNSKDLMSNLLNKINAPIETGYYIDIYCMSYKWNNSTSSFKRVPHKEYKSPLLIDIEFKDNGIAITQEYTGKQ